MRIKSTISVFMNKNIRQFVSATNFVEDKINVENIDINCVRSGCGKNAVLLLPGALGSSWTDFRSQIEQLPSKLPNYTIVAWDPPGYGRSQPPKRQFSVDFFHKDAAWASGLMKKLGFERFSLLGWSDGGITAIILAAKYPEHVEKLAIWGSNAYVLPEELKIYDGSTFLDLFLLFNRLIE
jgi:valacyclovir hydrolase